MTSRSRYDSLLRVYAEAHGLDWTWLKAQMLAESAGNPEAVSPVGAKGLLQFMPQTWEEWAPKGDPFNPEHAIEAGAKYMAWLLRLLHDDRTKALAAYNWGIGHVQHAIQEKGDAWADALPTETRQYLARITALAREMV